MTPSARARDPCGGVLAFLGAPFNVPGDTKPASDATRVRGDCEREARYGKARLPYAAVPETITTASWTGSLCSRARGEQPYTFGP